MSNPLKNLFQGIQETEDSRIGRLAERLAEWVWNVCEQLANWCPQCDFGPHKRLGRYMFTVSASYLLGPSYRWYSDLFFLLAIYIL